MHITRLQPEYLGKIKAEQPLLEYLQIVDIIYGRLDEMKYIKTRRRLYNISKEPNLYF